MINNSNSATTTTPLSSTIAVRDPLRSGFRMLQIPISAVLPTRASRTARNEAQQLSLCLLFQGNQCQSGDACRHIHVAPKDVAAARQASDKLAAQAPGATLMLRSCCAHHDKTAVAVQTQAKFSVQLRGHPTLTLSIDRFAPSQALTSIVEDATTDPIAIGNMRVCRSHIDNHCKLGAACRNVHVCREAYRNATSNVQGGAVTLPPILTAVSVPHPPTGPKPATVYASPAPKRGNEGLAPEDVVLPVVETASAKLTPHPPTPPSRPMSPTQCLARFVRRWNNPNIRSSGASNFTEDDGTGLNQSLEQALLGMTDALRISTGSSVAHTPTPPPSLPLGESGKTSFDRQFFAIVA